MADQQKLLFIRMKRTSWNEHYFNLFSYSDLH